MARRCAPILLLVLLPLAGCFDNTYVKEDRTDRRPRVLAVTDHEGGSHDCVLIHDRLWYVGQGPRLLVLEGRGALVKAVEAGPVGKTGAITDLVMHRGDLVGVVGGDAVVRWDIANPRAPVLIDRVDARSLGLEPWTLSLVGSDLYISGRGGVLRASDGRLFLKGENTGGVVASVNGIAAVSGRQVRLLEDGKFVGAATALEPGVAGVFGFALSGSKGSTVGLMGPDMRERSAEVFSAPVVRMRVTGDRLWVLAEDSLATWNISSGEMKDPVYAKVKGARDVAALNDNLFAMVGSFGRAVYRLHDDRDGAGDEFTDVKREPGRLEQSVFDGRRIVAGSSEGYWLYPIRGKATLSDKTIDVTQLPETKATLAWGTATIEAGDGKPETPDEARGVRIDGPSGKGRWSPGADGWVNCVAAIDGQLWVGHWRGITVLRQVPPIVVEEDEDGKPVAPKQVQLEVVDELRIPGSVTWLHPLRTGGGAAWVSRFGGMGVAEFVPEGETPKKSPAE
jgi:hypothetical protein